MTISGNKRLKYYIKPYTHPVIRLIEGREILCPNCRMEMGPENVVSDAFDPRDNSQVIELYCRNCGTYITIHELDDSDG